MVATVEVRADWGGADNAPGTIDQTITNLRYKEADNNTQDLNNPVTIPAAGTKYSYWKHTFLEVTVAGGFTQIDNVNIWVDTFNWTGVVLEIGDQHPIHSSTATTGYDVADGLNVLTTHTDITTLTDHGATHTSSGTARNVTISETSSILDAVGETTNYWVTNIEVGTSAVAGTQTARTVNVEYDEI
jgi:hypothetical protein